MSTCVLWYLECYVKISRPGQTAHCLQVRDRKWGARGPGGRLASAKLVIYVKYGISIYYLFKLK